MCYPLLGSASFGLAKFFLKDINKYQYAEKIGTFFCSTNFFIKSYQLACMLKSMVLSKSTWAISLKVLCVKMARKTLIMLPKRTIEQIASELVCLADFVIYSKETIILILFVAVANALARVCVCACACVRACTCWHRDYFSLVRMSTCPSIKLKQATQVLFGAVFA